MASLIQAKTEEDIKKLTVSEVKKAYNTLAATYNKLIERDYVYCHKCNEFISDSNFYSSSEYKSGYFPICKKCLLEMVEQRTKKGDKPNETKESVQKVLQMMDLPYIDKLYDDCYRAVVNEAHEKNRKSPFLQMVVILKSLPQYKGKTWKDSEFADGVTQETEIEIKENSRLLKSAKKRFGNGYSNSDLIFLETEMQDWITRYLCENKAQELLFKRVCFKELDIEKAQKEGKDTKELDKSLQELLGSLNLKPSQNTSNTISESKTFGQLIARWEEELPIPEPEDEFKDCDKIGKYLDVFFKGHLSKMMGLKNGLSATYEQFMSKYTVNKPEYDEDTDSEVLFEQIFGSKYEED